MSTSQMWVRVIDPALNRDELVARPAEPIATRAFTADAPAWCIPGLVDVQARLREPGPRRHGTMESETCAARRGGFRHLACPPDTDPVMDHGALVRQVRDRADALGQARVYPIGALTQGLEGRQLAAMAGLKAAGCVGVSQAGRALAHQETQLRCLEYAASLDLTVFFAPEEPSLAAGGCAHDGFMAARLGLGGLPVLAETTALASFLLMAEHTGARVHVGPLSSARAVELVAAAQQRGVSVTASVAMHQLHLTDAAIDGFNAYAHVRPPLRSESDRQALIAGVASGVITAICSDHQPLEAAAKLAPFAQTLPGISSLETVLPLGMALVRSGALSAMTLVRALTSGPAAILRLPVGQLDAPGAGQLLIDPEAPLTVGDAAWCSVGRNTPWLGRTLQGAVVAHLS